MQSRDSYKAVIDLSSNAGRDAHASIRGTRRSDNSDRPGSGANLA